MRKRIRQKGLRPLVAIHEALGNVIDRIWRWALTPKIGRPRGTIRMARTGAVMSHPSSEERRGKSARERFTDLLVAGRRGDPNTANPYAKQDVDAESHPCRDYYEDGYNQAMKDLQDGVVVTFTPDELKALTDAGWSGTYDDEAFDSGMRKLVAALERSYA